MTAAMAEFSWQRHLADRGAYADWVDRGRLRPDPPRSGAPTCARSPRALDAEIRRRRGRRSRGRRRRGWQADGRAGRALSADGVVITGTRTADHGRWPAAATILVCSTDAATGCTSERSTKRIAQSVCVIGSGETAASVVISLLKKAHRRSTIDVLTSRGVLYSRGESYDENRFYSDPGEWPRLAESHRREFLERTDRGVFSLQAEATLRQSRGFRTLAGRAASDRGRRAAGRRHHRVRRRARTRGLRPGRRGDRLRRPLVRDAARRRGTPPARQRPRRCRARAADRRRSLDRRADARRCTFPLLAGLAQGPGFPNLSCLGLLERPRSFAATSRSRSRRSQLHPRGGSLSETPDEVLGARRLRPPHDGPADRTRRATRRRGRAARSLGQRPADRVRRHRLAAGERRELIIEMTGCGST